MNVLVVLGHPRQGSFNHAIAEAAVDALRAAGHEVTFHDLYRERFDPVLPALEVRASADLPPVVAQHCRELAAGCVAGAGSREQPAASNRTMFWWWSREDRDFGDFQTLRVGARWHF